MNKIILLGHQIDTRTAEEIISAVISTARPTRILQINPEIMVALHNQNQSQLVKNVDIFAPNGVGIQWAAAYKQKPSFGYLLKTFLWIFLRRDKLKEPLSERFTSSNFTWPLLETLAKRKTDSKIIIAGSPKKGNIESTASHLRKLGQNLHIISFDTTNFNAIKHSQLVKLAKQEQPDLILLGIGYPAQEQVASSLRDKLTKGIIITEGGTFDYQQFGGQIKRAPLGWQNNGLEWLWRLLQEPIRIKRQIALLKFVFLVYKSK